MDRCANARPNASMSTSRMRSQRKATVTVKPMTGFNQRLTTLHPVSICLAGQPLFRYKPQPLLGYV